MITDIKLKKVKGGYLLYKSNGSGKHSHFFNRRAARKCLTYINKSIMPDKPYYVESCKRLLSDEEFKKLRAVKQKDRYYNQNTGVRR